LNVNLKFQIPFQVLQIYNVKNKFSLDLNLKRKLYNPIKQLLSSFINKSRLQTYTFKSFVALTSFTKSVNVKFE